MRIGIDARPAVYFRGSGIGTYTYELIRNLAVLDQENEYYLFLSQDPQGRLPTGGNLHVEVLGSSSDAEWEQQVVPARLAQLGVDLYHVPQNGIGLPQTKNCRQVITIHDVIPAVHPEDCVPGYVQDFQSKVPQTLQQADAVITVSWFSKEDIKRIYGTPSGKITVIWEAARDEYQMMDKPMAHRAVQTKFGLNPGYILNVGGFSSRKNLHRLIAAFRLMRQSMSVPRKLVLVGKPIDDYSRLQQLVQNLGLAGEVVFPGYVAEADLPLLYNCADLFVYPSFYEGFGLPPLEAMSCGTPVIAAQASCLPEIVADAALLIDPFDPDELALAMLRVLQNRWLAEELSRRGRQRAQRFSWPGMAGQTKELYMRVGRM